MKTKTTEGLEKFKENVVLTLKSVIAPYSKDFNGYPEFSISEAVEVIIKYMEPLLATHASEVRKELIGKLKDWIFYKELPEKDCCDKHKHDFDREGFNHALLLLRKELESLEK